MNLSRERSNNLSAISFREFSTHLEELTISYNIRIEIQSKNPA